MIKIVVVGFGLIGRSLFKEFQHGSNHVVFLNSKTFPSIYFNLDSLIRKLEEIDPDIVINAAAFTDTKAAEIKENERLLTRLNIELPRMLASCASRYGLIHLSTDYVYSGKNIPLAVENSATEPINQYGITKLVGEQEVLKSNRRSIILRLGGVYQLTLKSLLDLAFAGYAANREQFLLRDDLLFAPTPANTCASAIVKCATYLHHSGINFEPMVLNFSTKGQVSPYQFVYTGIDLYNEINPFAAVSDLKSLLEVSTNNDGDIKRPLRSLMSCAGIERLLSKKIPDWNEALRSELHQNVNQLKRKYEFLEK